MIPGAQDMSGVSQTSAAAGDATKPGDRWLRYQRALQAGQAALAAEQHGRASHSGLVSSSGREGYANADS